MQYIHTSAPFRGESRSLGPNESERHLDRFIRFFANSDGLRDQHTDKQTDIATSVTIGHI